MTNTFFVALSLLSRIFHRANFSQYPQHTLISLPPLSLRVLHFREILLSMCQHRIMYNTFNQNLIYDFTLPIDFLCDCRLQSIAAHRNPFVQRLSVRSCVCPVVTLSCHSHVSQATYEFLGMLPLFFFFIIQHHFTLQPIEYVKPFSFFVCLFFY